MTSMHLPAHSLMPNFNFCVNYLNVQEELKELLDNEEIEKLIQHAEDIASTAETCYEKIVSLLTCASSQVHAKFCPDAEFIDFHDNHTFSPTNHPNDVEAGRPDIIGLLQSVLKELKASKANRIPWHLVLSTVEEKRGSDAKDGPGQSAAYLGCANQSRPDLVGMYGLALSPRGFNIQYSCPAGLTTSQEFSWTSISALLSYIYTLYFPRPDFASRDPSITLAGSDNILSSPTWDIDVGNKVYKNCQVKFVGQPWRRMTWVAKAEGDESELPIVIKDSYHDVQSSFKEGEMYKILHKNGPAPGFARIEREYEVECEGTPIKVSMNGCTRIKTRLIMKTCGVPLNECKTIVDFFKAMYDVLESHRWAVLERNLLHRDISYGNIVVDAEDAPEDRVFEDPNRMIFINGVLNNRPHALPVARLLDFDNCARLDRMKPESKNYLLSKEAEVDQSDQPLRCRTGTPKFIARSVGLGEILVDNSYFEPMPELPDDLAAKYEQVYQNDQSGLRQFHDENGSTHGGYLDAQVQRKYKRNSSLKEADFAHHPRHDAESVFWCIVVFVLLAKPLNSEEDSHNHELNTIWQCIAEHEIGPSGSGDKRLPLMNTGHWAKWLHEDLGYISQLMEELTLQVHPEYALLNPPPRPLHLHEAMQRLILRYVHLWETTGPNVELDTNNIRVAERYEKKPMEQAMHQFPIIGQIISTSSLGKRSSYAVGGREESGAKRQRTITLPNVMVNVVCPGSDEEDQDDYEEEEDDDEEEEEEEYHGGFRKSVGLPSNVISADTRGLHFSTYPCIPNSSNHILY